MAWPGARRTYRTVSDGISRPADQKPTPPLQTWGSGYEQLINRWDVPPPVFPVHNPNVGNFVMGNPISLDAIGARNRVRYVPAWYGDSRIGRNPGGFAIGRGALGHMRPVHGRLELVGSGVGVGDFAVGVSAVGPLTSVLVERP